MLRRFGYYSTESNGHLSEYVPWYRKRPDEDQQWIDLSCWINGETGGYLRVCTEGRNWFETDFPNWLKSRHAPIAPENRGHEHGSYIIEALETGRVYRGHFNVRQQRLHHQPARRRIVEVPGYVDRNGINMPRVGDLPLACAATCTASINVQRMARRSRRARRRDPAQAGHAARPADRRGLQPRGDLADGRRDARRAGPVAAEFQEGRAGRQGSPDGRKARATTRARGASRASAAAHQDRRRDAQASRQAPRQAAAADKAAAQRATDAKKALKK